MSTGATAYRWTAQGPAYSVTNLYVNQMLYSSEPSSGSGTTGVAAGLPVRLMQVRSAIFFMHPMAGPRSSLRTATASLNGTALTCVLVSNNRLTREGSGGRHWTESEYCIDTASGALITYSAAPGLYTLYDYAQAIHFHDRLIPNKFTITEAGRTIIEAQTVSASDPPQDPSLFKPAGLAQIGVGALMTAPWCFWRMVPAAGPTSSSQMVVVHGMQTPTGQIRDAELLASSDSALNQKALEVVSHWPNGGVPGEAEPGATPQSHEVLLTLTFVAAQQ